jgi:hypothetical protein
MNKDTMKGASIAFNAGLPPSLEEMKEVRNMQIRLAEKAAYAYFCECEVGPERECAHQVYTNILYSLRTG